MDIINKIGKKNLIIIAIAVVSLIFFAFLPYISMEAGEKDQSVAFFEDVFFEDGFGYNTIFGIITVLAGVGMIALILLEKKKESLLCMYVTIAAAVESFILASSLGGYMEEAMGGFGKISAGAGYGLIIAVLGFIACAVVNVVLPEDQQ